MVLRMILQRIFRSFGNDEVLVQKLADSYPMRKVARVIAYFFFRGQGIVQDSGLNRGFSTERLRNFVKSLKNNLKVEYENFKLKDKQK